MMTDQVPGVLRRRRGTDRPPREYELHVDGERAGWAERLLDEQGRWHGRWRFYFSAVGDWATFGRPGAFAQGEQWLADLHRSAKARNTQVTAIADASVHVLGEKPGLSGLLANPFAGDLFADPLS